MIAAAAESGATVFFPGFVDYAHFFSGPSRGIAPRYPVPTRSHAWPRVVRGLFYPVGLNALRLAKRGLLLGIPWFETRWDVSQMVDIGQPAFLELISDRLVLCGGFFYRSVPLLEKHAKLVRAYFTPSSEFAAYASKIERDIRRPGERIVGVHIRRRDYRVFKGGIYFYELDVFAAYMRRIGELLNGPCRFVICCEEPFDPFIFADFDVTFGPGDLIGDLLTLSSCDLIVGPPSTFSGWASFSHSIPRHFIRSADPAHIEKLQLADFGVEWDGFT